MDDTNMLFPPGILRKLGLRAFNASMSSGRFPLALFLYVGGNKLIRLKLTEPLPESNSMANVLLMVDAAVSGSSSKVCSTHDPD